LKIPALWTADQAHLREGNTVNASDPTREVALVGKTCAYCNLSQAASTITNEFDRASQSQMHDVAMRTDANGSREHASEMERAAPRHLCQRGDFDGLIEMGDHMVSEPLEDVFSQHASWWTLEL
jgi:hypothetical protein